jgi:hypothetical protein
MPQARIYPAVVSATPTPLTRRHGMTHAEFLTTYVAPLQPVVLADSLNRWDAVGRWTPAYFRQTFPSYQMTIDDRSYRLDEAMDAIERSTPDRPGPYLHIKCCGQGRAFEQCVRYGVFRYPQPRARAPRGL